MTYEIAGVDSIIIYFSDTISKDIYKNINNSYHNIKNSKIKGIIEVVPSYTSIYIQFDIFLYTHEEVYKKINHLLKNNILKLELEKENIIQIPVYYGDEVGFDLQRVAKHNNISKKEVIEIHSLKVYDLYTIGFSPAFGYMGEVDKKISTPRLESPRLKIPKNSVAIADKQTAIYPQQSPGGWNILGRTYIDIFDKSLQNFSYFKVGDKIRFIPISKEEFLKNGGVI